MKTTTITTLTSLLTLVSAHGYFESPKGRQPGDAFKAACGQQAYYQLKSDINGNIQGLKTTTANQADYDACKCHLWQCKGLEFDDNSNNVQSYTAGQQVPLYFQIVAPHSGVANVSVIDLASNTVIGSPLKSWDQYALTSETMQADWQNFTVTIPTGLDSKCATKGACAIQMHWDAATVNQTYQSCIDFTVGGGTSERNHSRDFAQMVRKREWQWK